MSHMYALSVSDSQAPKFIDPTKGYPTIYPKKKNKKKIIVKHYIPFDD